MLQQCRKYIDANPLPGWLLLMAITGAFQAALYFILASRKSEMAMVSYFTNTVALPTVLLVQRFSDARLREKPVPPVQEAIIGFLALAALLLSFGCLVTNVVSRRLGFPFSPETSSALLTVFGIAALAAPVLGYTARRTRPGRWTFFVATGWLVFLVVAAFGRLALGWPRG